MNITEQIILNNKPTNRQIKSAEKYYNQKNIHIYKGDVLNKNSFSKAFADLIVTSPPYNVGIDYNSNNDELTYQQYLEFSKKWMKNCFDWSKTQARFLLNIPLDKNKGGHKSVGADLTRIAQDVGWKYHSTIIWNEGNISRRTAWGSWMRASAPYVIAPVELIVILYKDQWKKENTNSRPHISIVCNFTKPTETKPSLLTFNEVTTLFHEFGHALHGMLADTTYPSLSGTSVYWDFVELPSQLLENWCYEKEALDLFAKHYKTDEPIPMELVQKIKDSATFLEGMQTMRQLSFGLLDMAWHGGESPETITSVKEFETKAFKDTLLYPDVAENCMSTAFSHIFQGGYSSGYYSYKWAEVLDADAFEYFKETGIFNKETAIKFVDNVLSKGGTEKPMVLYKRFRGKEPNADALLKRAGLLK